MQITDFKRILTTFADSETDIDIAKGTMLVQVRDEVIVAKLYQQDGELIVEEEDQRLPARRWLVNRIARLPLLADRILSYVPETDGFLTPSGRLLDQPDFSVAAEEVFHPDALATALDVLGRRPAGTTSLLYLTSDAGEGKTTLINHMARTQAEAFKAKRSDWLLVPVLLGGRTFLRFDDVVVAALVNRLRFQLLYYDAFIELVKFGVIVPAFDGFEEMMISSSSGEAISAVGNLVGSLSSSGSVLVAARKAYFDNQSFKAQARLFDAVGTGSVAFARLSLDRWNEGQFVSYASGRGLSDAQAVYTAVAARLQPGHPLLTRAVLVRRLVDVASAASGLEDLLQRIGSAPQHYFFQFVNALVEREAHEKWIDLSGEPHQPLLTVEEHHELLGMVAQEMWLSSTDSLRQDVLAVIAEVFAESRKKAPALARQICERLKQHSLLASTGTAANALAFDHEDFRGFYLGEAVGRTLRAGSRSELRALLQPGVLPRAATDEAILHLGRLHGDSSAALSSVQSVASAESSASLVKENCGALAIGLVQGQPGRELRGMTFPEDALKARALVELAVSDSYFHASSLSGTKMQGCKFTECRFERLELHADTRIIGVFQDCEIMMVVRADRDEQVFDPAQIGTVLAYYGAEVRVSEQVVAPPGERHLDEELVLLERVMRVFLRANQVNEDVIRMKLGVKSAHFLDTVLPALLKAGILEVVPYIGSGTQRRFRVRVQMQKLHDSLAQCGGSFSKFLEVIGKTK